MNSGYTPPEEFIVVDVESNGLYGQPFCVGAVKMNWGGRVLDRALWRCPIDEVPDEWVEENVLPNIEYIKINTSNVRDMINLFAKWVSLNCVTPPIFVDAGFPVDFNFLHEVGKRFWGNAEKSPFPLHDICSILAAHGVDANVSRAKYAEPLIGERQEGSLPHDPSWDAELSGLSLIRATRRDNRK